MPDTTTARVTMEWPADLKESVRERVGARGLTPFVLEAVRAKLGTHDAHKEDSKELNEVKFLVQRLADTIALRGDYEDPESTLREIDLPPWVDTTGWPDKLARAINPEESTPEPVTPEREPLERPSTAFERPEGNVHVLPEGTELDPLIDSDSVDEIEPAGDDDPDLHRPMFLTPSKAKEQQDAAPGVGDVVLKEPPAKPKGDLLERVRARAAEMGVDLSGIDLKPASEVVPNEAPASTPEVSDAEPVVVASNPHNHSWKRMDDPHGLYDGQAYVCDCGATMDSKKHYPSGEAPAPKATPEPPSWQTKIEQMDVDF